MYVCMYIYEMYITLCASYLFVLAALGCPLSSCHLRLTSHSFFLPPQSHGFRLDVLVCTTAATGIALERMNRFCFKLKISFSWELTSRAPYSFSHRLSLISPPPSSFTFNTHSIVRTSFIFLTLINYTLILSWITCLWFMYILSCIIWFNDISRWAINVTSFH